MAKTRKRGMALTGHHNMHNIDIFIRNITVPSNMPKIIVSSGFS